MTSHVVSALVAKRRDMACQIRVIQDKLQTMLDDLAHIDAALRLFDPSFHPESIRTPRKRLPPVLPDLHLHILDTLREMGEPVGTRALTRRLVEKHKLDPTVLIVFDKAVSACLGRQEGKFVERVGSGKPARWRLKD